MVPDEVCDGQEQARSTLDGREVDLDWLMPELPEWSCQNQTCNFCQPCCAERPRTRSPTHSLQLAARREGDRGRALFHGIVDVPDDGQEAPLVRLDGDRW